MTDKKESSENKDDKLKKVKKKVAGGAAAAGLGASVFLGGMFSSPEELTQKTAESYSSAHKTQVVMLADLDDDDSDEENDGEENQEEESTGLFAGIKKKILTLPVGVRAVVGVPLWAVGWLIIHLLSLAWSAVLAPVAGFLLKWVLAGLALTAVFAAAMKLAFPHLPLKKILRPKNILYLILGTVALGAVDRILPLFWSEYGGYRFLIILAGGILVLLAVGIPFLIKQNRIEKEKERLALEKAENKNLPGQLIENTLEIVKKAEQAAGIAFRKDSGKSEK